MENKQKNQNQGGRIADLSGQTFGRLTAIAPTDERKDRAVVWECECSCGGKKKVLSKQLKRGLVKSCGCLRQDVAKERIKDLTGQTFGRLKVISLAEDKIGQSVAWECECSCGGKKKVGSQHLVRGLVKSCGCLQTEIEDLSGQTFGRLTAIAPTTERVRGSVVWECECSCGNKVKISHIKHRKSCGCLQKERIKDLSGQTFGRLTVISMVEKRVGRSVAWECKCICGDMKQVSSTSLLTGNVRSCGCLRRNMDRIKDLSGQTFGRLRVISLVEDGSRGNARWNCVCTCGTEKTISSSDLTKTRSCGCLHEEGLANFHEQFCVEGTLLKSLTSKLRKSNTSGVTGVSLQKKDKRWRASITFQGKSIHLGIFDNIEDAAAARKAAEDKYFKPMLEKYQDRLNPNKVEE